MVKPGYKQTEIGVIPEDWEDKKLGDVGKVCMCKRIFADQTSDTGEIPFFKIGTFGKEADAYISRELYEDFKRRFSYPQRGDVLISAAGTLGRSVVFDGKDSYFQDSNIVWLDLDKEQLCNEYLYHYYKVIQWASSEGSTIARLYNGIICNTHIAVPDVEEQKKIANVLSDVDELIFLTEKQLSKKKAIKQGAIQELLTGKKRLPGFSGDWQNFNLMKHSKIKARIGWQGLKKSEYLDSGYALLVTGTDFADGKVQWDSCHYVTRDRYDQDRNIQIQNNDILITKDGSLGKAALVQGLTKPATLNSGIFVIRPLQNAYDPVFVYHILSSLVFKDFLDKLSAGSTIIHLYQKDVGKFEFLLPPTIEEQKDIAAVLSEMDADIAALEEKLAKYRQVKQGMMQQLLTGKIRLV